MQSSAAEGGDGDDLAPGDRSHTLTLDAASAEMMMTGEQEEEEEEEASGVCIGRRRRDVTEVG